jgi:hypothetical protein
VRLGLHRLGEPGVNLGRSQLGDDVALAIGAGARLGFAGDRLAIPGQPAQRRVDLPKGQRLAAAEVGVVLVLEVLAVARLTLEQAKEGKRNAHEGDSTLSVYSTSIPSAVQYSLGV